MDFRHCEVSRMETSTIHPVDRPAFLSIDTWTGSAASTIPGGIRGQRATIRRSIQHSISRGTGPRSRVRSSTRTIHTAVVSFRRLERSLRQGERLPLIGVINPTARCREELVHSFLVPVKSVSPLSLVPKEGRLCTLLSRKHRQTNMPSG